MEISIKQGLIRNLRKELIDLTEKERTLFEVSLMSNDGHHGWAGITEEIKENTMKVNFTGDRFIEIKLLGLRQSTLKFLEEHKLFTLRITLADQFGHIKKHLDFANMQYQGVSETYLTYQPDILFRPNISILFEAIIY